MNPRKHLDDYVVKGMMRKTDAEFGFAPAEKWSGRIVWAAVAVVTAIGIYAAIGIIVEVLK